MSVLILQIKTIMTISEFNLNIEIDKVDDEIIFIKVIEKLTNLSLTNLNKQLK